MSPGALPVLWKRCSSQGAPTLRGEEEAARLVLIVKLGMLPTPPPPTPARSPPHPLLVCALRGHCTDCPQAPPLVPRWADQCRYHLKSESSWRARGSCLGHHGHWVPHPLPQPASGLQECPLSALDNRMWGTSLDHSWQPGQKSPEMTGSVCAGPSQPGDSTGGDRGAAGSSLCPLGAAAPCPALRLIAGEPEWFLPNQDGVRGED